MRKFTSLLLLGFALGSFAQTPGGVSGSELWFKTAPLNSDLQGYYRWQDFSGDSIRLMLLDSRGVKSELTLPNSSVHYFNFNPSLWLADGFRSLSANSNTATSRRLPSSVSFHRNWQPSARIWLSMLLTAEMATEPF